MLLDPKVNAQIAEYLVARSTVDAAVDLLNEETKALYPYDGHRRPTSSRRPSTTTRPSSPTSS